jgi:hypothetical protein
MENETLRDDAGGNIPFDPWPFPWWNNNPIWRHPGGPTDGPWLPWGPVFAKLQADVSRAMVALTFEDPKLKELAIAEITESFTTNLREAAK